MLFLRRIYFFSLVFTTLLFPALSFSSQRYLLCGPDEDGCFPDDAHYCACIPYDEVNAQNAYCLDFDNMTCSPIKNRPNCAKDMIYPNQGQCLATIFQSEPIPPCSVTTKQFCTSHHSAFCGADGNPKSCHY